MTLRLGLGLGLTRNGLSPALSLGFLGEALDPRITFSRGTTATRVNASGVLETVGTTTPRFDYDPVTLAPKGLLIEESRANLLLNSLLNGTVLSTQGVTVTAVAHTISFYGTGTITLTGAHAATVVGTGVYPNRQTLTFTPSAGTLTCTVTGSVQYAQVEVGSFATSFIPTAGSTVTRSADVATMTGTNFSSWFNPVEGTFVVTARTLAASARAVTVSAGAVTNQLWVQAGATAETALQVYTAGAFVAQIGINPATELKKIAAAYKANDFAASINGLTAATDTSGALAAYDRVNIGSRFDGTAGFLNGHIQSLSYYSTRLPDAQLQSLTA